MPAFLFTDIESSTRLWEEHPEEMSVALERHDAIILRSISGRHGTILKTTGDGAIGVFADAAAAVGAAIDAQRALQSESWAVTPIRVRMGIHTGTAQARGGDYFGAAMNRAARIMAAGHGNQVLLSSAAVEAALPVPDEASFRDLGLHRLRDLTLPVHLYQLLHPGLVETFPAPRTLDARPNNLPIQPTDLVGRGAELAAMHSIIASPGSRLVTVTGPGGIGKTRLALQLAADLTDRFADGVFFVDLSTETDSEAAFETVVRTLSLPAAGSDDAVTVLETQLRDREMLLVLDNFEQVIDAGADLAGVLGYAPRVKVIVTSRETLDVRGERVYRLPPLALPDTRDPPALIGEAESVQLFVDRATAVHPDFELTDENAATIAELCRRLDGLPLAIELAAARLAVFSTDVLLERVTRHFGALGSGGRDMPERQRTLWGAIAWSYDLLDDDERALFELLSVFSTTRLDSIEGVAEAALRLDVSVDILGSLVAKSLVRRNDSESSLTFSMLQSVKEYAAERLSTDPRREAAFATAHARYFADLAGDQSQVLQSPDPDRALNVLETELDNLQIAWRLWLDRHDVDRLRSMVDPMWALFGARGWYHEAIGLARDMLEGLGGADPTPQGRFDQLTSRTRLARALMAVHGYDAEVEQAFQRALELVDAAGAGPERVSVLRSIASYYTETANPQPALEIGRELVEIGKTSGDEAVELEGHVVIGSALLIFDVDECLAHFSQVIDRYDPEHHGARRYRIGPDPGVVARIGSAMVLWESGRLDSAVRSAESALAFAQRVGHPYGRAWALYHAGFLSVNRGRFDTCVTYARELAAIADDNDYAIWRTLARVLEGAGLTGLGSTKEGLALTEEGVALYRGLATPPVFWPLMLMLRSMVYATAGDPVRALELVDEAAAIWADGGGFPNVWVARADLLQRVGSDNQAEAEELYNQALAEAEALGLSLTMLKAATRLVELRRRLGRPDDGTEGLARILASFTEGAEEVDVAAARLLLA